MIGNNGKGFILQKRDMHAVREIGSMRVADSEQVKCVGGFGSRTRVNARLLALTRAGLLCRFYLGSQAGGKKALYTVTREGTRLVGGVQPGLRRKSGETLVADYFISHQLFVNEIYCLLKYRAIPVPEVRFLRWVSFREPVASGVSLIPDAYFEVAEREKVLAGFLEVDLGTESRSVWQRKVQEYLRYAIGGDAAEQFGAARFRVLVITNSDGRLATLRTATASLTDKIFWFTTFDSIKRDSFWSTIWLRPSDDCLRPLIERRP